MKILLLLLLSGLICPVGLAGPAMSNGHPTQDEIFEAVKAGDIRPLSDIEAVAKARLPGQIIKVEIERKHGRWLYEIKMLDEGGRRREALIDGKTGDIVKVDE